MSAHFFCPPFDFKRTHLAIPADQQISALNTLGGGLISTIANENPSFCISGVFVPELEFNFSTSRPFDCFRFLIQEKL